MTHTFRRLAHASLIGLMALSFVAVSMTAYAQGTPPEAPAQTTMEKPAEAPAPAKSNKMTKKSSKKHRKSAKKAKKAAAQPKQ